MTGPGRKPIVIHPLLFAAWPIIFLFSHNRSESIGFQQVLLPLGVSLAVSLIFWGLLNLAYRNAPKSALVVSLMVLLFFSFGHFHAALGGRTVAGLRIWQYRYLFGASGAILLAAVLWTVRTRGKLRQLTAVLNLVSVALVAISLFNLSMYSIRRGPWQQFPEEAAGGGLPGEFREDYPDIYYIILDAYAHDRSFREEYDYDNREFTGFLQEQGFYLAERSFSNYAFTAPSLASSLNFEYLDHQRYRTGNQRDIFAELSYLIENNNTVRFLKSRGYRFVHFDSGYSCNERNRHADLQLRYGYANEFLVVLGQSTMLRPWRRGLNLLADDHRRRILGIFSGVSDVHRRVPGPKFVFAHLPCPRGPFVFGPAGEEVDFDHSSEPRERRLQAYVDQVKFVNSRVRDMLQVLLSSPERLPVIVIQADHGLGVTRENSGRDSDRYLRSRMWILNAYFLPGDGSPALYPSVSPVNTFRIIFNRYFGTDYPLLPDRSYYNWSGYDFVDVTERVSFSPEGS